MRASCVCASIASKYRAKATTKSRIPIHILGRSLAAKEWLWSQSDLRLCVCEINAGVEHKFQGVALSCHKRNPTLFCRIGFVPRTFSHDFDLYMYMYLV
jgi:hypothetical protein